MNGANVLVVGGGGVLGREIVRVLRKGGANVKAAYRTERPGFDRELSSLGAHTARLDLSDAEATRRLLEEADAAIFTPILSTASPAAMHLRENQPAVFFSSNNVAIDPGAPVYARLLQAEAKVCAAAPQAIILRPTMIYGYPGDGNFSSLIKTMRRSPVTPLPGAGKALQQPVFYKALARAAVAALFAPADHPHLCAVAGPEPLTLQETYRAVARAAKARTLIAPLPLGLAANTLKIFERCGFRLPISSVQMARAGLDKTPSAAHVILTDTGLEEGLRALAAAIDAKP